MPSFRVRYPGGPPAVVQVESNAALGDLLREIARVTALDQDLIQVKYGAPRPQPLSLNDLSVHVASSGLSTGDTLTITLKDPPPASTNAPLASQTPSLASKSNNVQGSYAPLGALGNLVLRRVPDDNSCLFRAAGKVLTASDDAVGELRKIVAATIQEKPDVYSDAILGQPRQEYIRKILEPNTWGGGLELAILSEHFKTELCAVDIHTGRIDRYGEGQWGTRGLLVYSGIHYDFASCCPLVPPYNDQPTDFDTLLFPADDDAVLAALKDLSTQLKGKRYYTDTATFTLSCGICKAGLVGEKDAVKHATETGHQSFTEY